MDIPKRLTRTEAEAAGLTVNTQAYPWVACFPQEARKPVETFEVYTDLEASLVKRLSAAESAVRTQTVTCYGIRRMLGTLEEELSMGHDSPTLEDSISETLMDATAIALTGSAYSITYAQFSTEDLANAVICASRHIGKNGEYLAEMYIQAMSDSLVFKGYVAHADQPSRRYDDESFLYVMPESEALEYIEVVITLRQRLDTLVARVAREQGFEA